MAGKLPYMKFFPGDWLKEPSLRRCSHSAKGVYIDVLCLMWECEERGVLATAGRAWSDEEVARAVGGDQHQTIALVTELVVTGVVARRTDGAIYSRRMVREENERKKANIRLKKHRESAARNADDSTDETPHETPDETEMKRALSEYESVPEPPVPPPKTDVPVGNSEGQEKESLGDKVRLVCAHYQTHHPKARPGEKERAKIRQRLQDGYSVDELKQAIDGCHKTPWNLGENPGGTLYLSLELIMRESSQVARFIEANSRAPGPVLSEKSRRGARAVQSFIQRHKPPESEVVANPVAGLFAEVVNG